RELNDSKCQQYCTQLLGTIHSNIDIQLKSGSIHNFSSYFDLLYSKLDNEYFVSTIKGSLKGEIFYSFFKNCIQSHIQSLSNTTINNDIQLTNSYEILLKQKTNDDEKYKQDIDTLTAELNTMKQKLIDTNRRNS